MRVSTTCDSGWVRSRFVMWNDTDTPLAFLITFRTYGTWLHGDARGSTDRNHNIFGTPHIPPNSNWKSFSEERMSGRPLVLDAERRSVVEQSIRETVVHRGWKLLAVNVRTNHVHTVITANKKPELVLNALKANATRMLKASGHWLLPHSPWADKGSCRWIWNEHGIANAIEYVVNGQGGELPKLD
jgi:REP element-mobilizing transposase RayT